MILSICGRARAGKSTVAQALMQRAHYRELTAEVYELSKYVMLEAICEGRLPANKPREKYTKDDIAVLIEIGEGRRENDTSYWLRKAEAEILEDGADVAIIPNARTTPEFKWTKSKGGTLIKVTALNKNGSEFVADDRWANGELETSHYLWPADYYLSVHRGDSALLTQYAFTLFDHIWAIRGEKEVAA